MCSFSPVQNKSIPDCGFQLLVVTVQYSSRSTCASCRIFKNNRHQRILVIAISCVSGQMFKGKNNFTSSIVNFKLNTVYKI